MMDDLIVFEENSTDLREASGFVRRVSKTDRTVEFRLSDRSLDRHGTKIEPDGIRTENYAKNPIFVWGHDAYGGNAIENVIGKAVAFGPVDVIERGAGERAFDITVEFAGKDVNPRGELALQLVRGGFLSSVSIGARVLDWKKEKTSKREVMILTETELLEASLVAVPSNPNAVALQRSLVPDYDALSRVDSEHIAETLEAWLHETPRGVAVPPVGADITAELGNELVRIHRREVAAREFSQQFSAAARDRAGR